MNNIRSLSNQISFSLAYLTAAVYLQLSPLKALAFGGPTPEVGGAEGGDARGTIEATLDFVLGFLALLAVVFLVIGGFRIVMAGGNEENVTKGRKTIIYAIVGLMVIFFANVIIGFFTEELGSAVP